MSITIDDLRPKNFIISVQGLELDCKPLKMSHALIMAKLGDVFKNPKSATKDDIRQAEADLEEVIGELVPQLKGVELEMSVLMDVMTQMMEHVQPSDNRELKDKGVTFDEGPKAETAG